MKKIIFAAALLVGGASALGAQNHGADSLETIAIEGVQVVHHSRAGERTPVAHTNLSRREISRRVVSGGDIPSMLTGTPSVVATSDAGTGIGYTSLSIRGSDGTRINVTANGVPLGDGESQRLYWVNVPDFAASAGDIQIQRGVGTSTNGAGAFGGSINMVTEPLGTEPFAEVSASYGSFNTHRESVRWGTSMSEGRWRFGGRLSNIGSDGYVDRASADLKSYFVQAGYFGRKTRVRLLSFGGHEATYHAWNGLTQAQMDELGRRYNTAGEIWGPDGVVGFYPDQKDFYTQYNFQLIVDRRLGEGWNLNLTGHYTRGDGYYEEYKGGRWLPEYGFAVEEESDLVRRKRMWNNFGGAMASATYSSRNLDVAFGGAWNRYAGDHFGQVVWLKNYSGDDFTPAREYYRNSSVKDDLSLFAKASWQPARGLSLWGDVQFRHVDHRIDGTNDVYDWREGVQAMQRLDVDRNFDFFNPKVGAYYDIAPGRHSVYASFGVAHKEPTRDNYTESMLDASPRSERLMDWEAGYKFASRGRRFTADVNLYYMRYRDQLVLTGEVNDIGEPLTENVPLSYRSGIELSAEWRVTRWFDWKAFATFSRNRVEDNEIAYSPSIIAGNILSFHAGGFHGALQTNYVGRQYLTNSGDDNITLPGYCVSSLRASWRFELPRTRFLEVGVTVGNIFDARYSSFGYDAGGEAAYFPQAGINAVGNVTFSF